MISCQDLKFSYPGESFDLRVKSLAVEKGESVALVGPSGCGKTTLLNLIAGILLPGEGSVEVEDVRVNGMNLTQRQAFRLGNMGMVPQNFELLDYLTVAENILTPIRLSGRGIVQSEHRERLAELAGRTGMSDLLQKFPTGLSQGERQRTALCRGLVGNPALILADEPTGNLDPGNQDRIVSLLLEEARRLEASVLMITHEPGLLGRFDRVVDLVELRKGADS
ncbi:MAG: ABC transporter ATP-binding protein [Verrucomicrobiales bacterium]|nr:ABC transporter ATP-binding protein [Verrucomicrobiales bacterium]